MERKLTTIVTTDVVGYSRLMERDETGTLERLQSVRANIIDPAISRHSGRTIKLMGDGALMEFSSVVEALQCTVDIQEELTKHNDTVVKDHQIQLRIGLHLGDVIVEGDDIYGDGVNISARLESIAEPGGIMLSKQVHDHVGGNVRVKFVSLGEQKLKNISRPIQVYSVALGEAADTSPGIIQFGDYALDTALFELRQAGKRVAVEPQVFDLILFLAKNRERTVTKEELFTEIWNGRIVSDAALSSQIKAARKVLGDNGSSQHTIRTIHGRGIRFVAEIKGTIKAAAADREFDNPALSAIAKKPSVAILPLSNLNGNPEEDYFADGITEDITTALSKNRWLNVVARNPAFAFRNSRDGIKTIGEKLGADYIVTGSVRKVGNRARITIEVVDAKTEYSLWSERFDRDMEDIFQLQDEITEIVTARIEVELGLTEQRKASTRPRKNLGAWDLYQLGVAEFYKFSPDSNQKCQDLLRQCLEMDPEFAGAHSRLAYAIVLSMVYFDAAPDQPRLDEALASAMRGAEFDDQDANSYNILGRVHLARREYDLAIEALEHAVDLNPCLAVTYCALGDTLAYEGRLDEAIEQFEIAIRLSPHDPFRWAFYSYRSLAHLFRGEFEDAATWARRSVQIPNAQYWAKAHLVAALGHLDDEEKTRTALDDLKRTKSEFTLAFAREHLFYVKREDQMDAYIAGLEKAGVT